MNRIRACNRCGAFNAQDALFCKDCGLPLDADARQKSMEMARAASEQQAEKERKAQRIGYALLAVVFILYLALALAALSGGARKGVSPLQVLFLALAFPIIGYLQLFKTEMMFRFEHSFCIKNPKDAEPSDLYLAAKKLSGGLIWFGGLVLMLFVAL